MPVRIQVQLLNAIAASLEGIKDALRHILALQRFPSDNIIDILFCILLVHLFESELL